MMKIRLVTTFGAMALVAFAACTAQATVLEFGNHGSNADMALDYGSNINAAIANEFDISNGGTPNVALAWGPADANVLEFHNSANWIAPMAGGKLQFDVDASGQTAFPAAPTVDFVPDAPWVSVLIDSFMIGHAKDMHIAGGQEPAHDWIISLINLDTNAVEATHTTTALGVALDGVGAVETVNFNFVGDPGVSYQLLFDDTGDDSLYPSNFDGTPGNHPRGGIDFLTFRQSVPEPTTMALAAMMSLGLLATRKR